MQHDFANIVVPMDTHPAGAIRKYETKNQDGMKMRGLPKRNLPLPKTIIGSEDQAVDQNNGLETKIF